MILNAAIGWFNYRVAWMGTDFFKWMSVINFINLFVIIITSILKIFSHVNAVLFIESTLKIENGVILNNGWIWYVNDNETLNSFFTLADIMWLLSVVAFPVLQGGYLLYRGTYTHGLIITIEDNRMSRPDYVSIASS